MAALFETTGISEVQQRLQTMRNEVVPVAGIALRQELDAILAASQPLVPVDTGLLKSTGEIDGPFLDATSASGAVRYGGHGAAPYAADQHFNTSYHHDIGQSYYLQQPAFEATAGMLERIADAIRIAL